MIYSFLEPYGWAGWFAAALLVFAPYWFLMRYGEKSERRSFSKAMNWMLYLTAIGAILMPFIAFGYHLDGKIIAPTGIAGDVLRNANLSEYGEERWMESYVAANSGFLRPRDTYFLPWFTGLLGFGFVQFASWSRQFRKSWSESSKNRQKSKAVRERQQREEAERERQQKERNARRRLEAEKNTPEYSDLETAISFFSKKAKKINELDIDEDEKEMLLIKLQEKKEQAMEEYV